MERNLVTIDATYKDAKLKRIASQYEYLMSLFVFILLVGLMAAIKNKN